MFEEERRRRDGNRVCGRTSPAARCNDMLSVAVLLDEGEVKRCAIFNATGKPGALEDDP